MAMWPRRAPRPGQRGRPCADGPERDAVRSDDQGPEGWPHDDVATSGTARTGSGGPSGLVSDGHTMMWPHPHTAPVRARGRSGGEARVQLSGRWRAFACSGVARLIRYCPPSRGAARTRDRFVAEGAPPRSPEARRRGEGPHHHVALAWEGWPHDDVAKLSATCACGIRCGVADLRARSLKGGTSAPWAWRVNAGCWCGLSSGP